MLSRVIDVFVQAEDGIRDLVRSRGLGDVYKGQATGCDRTAGWDSARRSLRSAPRQALHRRGVALESTDQDLVGHSHEQPVLEPTGAVVDRHFACGGVTDTQEPGVDLALIHI